METILKKLIKEGRTFLLSLEDAELTCDSETGEEHADVTQFREALEEAASQLQVRS